MIESVLAAFFRLAKFLDTSVDRVIGADQLKPYVRRMLLREQTRSASAASGALLCAAVLVLITLLSLEFGRPAFTPLLIWALPTVGIYAAGVIYTVRMSRRVAALQWAGPTAAASIFGNMALGVLWGIMPNLVPLDDPTIRNAVTIASCSMLGASIFSLVSFPQAAIAFVVPMAIGCIVAVAGLESSADLTAQSLLILGMVGVLGMLSVRQARNFVRQHNSESMVHEKREIIGLLLKEFEDSAQDWIWGMDASGRIDQASRGFTQATGVPQEDLIGADFLHFLQCITPPGDPLMAQLEQAFERRETFNDSEICVRSGGVECWWRLTGKPSYNEIGEYSGYIGTASDVSEQKRAEKRITKLAHSDPLTGLLNRSRFTEQLNQCVLRLERYGSPFSVLYLDLDNFKLINDRSGHMAGDKVLVQVAKRIQGVVRETDFVARLGGDEFAILLTNDCSPDHCAMLAGRMIEAVRQPYEIEGETLSIGVSIGIAQAPANGTKADQILRNADMALYRAKNDGRSIFRFFESAMDTEVRERRVLEGELRDAISNGQLALHYQPVVNADDKQLMGFEALIRWDHPERGQISPADFMPIAEQSSLIVDIGDWTLKRACLDAADWPENLTVAVNLSAKHFRLSDTASVVERALKLSGLSPHRLELEVTEGLLLENSDQVFAKLGEVKALGVTVVLDDFGTGFSSINHLLRFPFDKIKIDKSFVEASGSDPVARDTLRAIAALGKTLKLKITAEGVETREQAEFLSEIACHQLQGFYFARPLDAVDMPHYLLNQVQHRVDEVKAEAQKAIIGRLAS